VKLLTRRPERYVPRHSTRGPAPQWGEDDVVDLTGDGTPPREVLVSVLDGLRGGPEASAPQS
jgi:hypothetical protein